MNAMTCLFLAQMEGPGMGAVIAAMLIPLLIALAISIFMIASVWKVYAKAGKPGWGCIIPFYGTILLCEMVGRPVWWFILLHIPFVNFIVGIIVMMDLAKSFGKDAGFGIGLILLSPIFWPILGFGSAQYQGPSA